MAGIDNVSTTTPSATLFHAVKGDVTINGGVFPVAQGNITINNNITHIHAPERSDDAEAVFQKSKDSTLKLLPANDFGTYHQDLIERKVPETGREFATSQAITEWASTSGSVLWCMGDPGAGKTYLSAAVIEHLESCAETNPGLAVIYAYITFRAQLTTWDVIVGLVRQLVESTELQIVLDLVTAVFKKHRYKSTRPSLLEVTKLLRMLLKHYHGRFVSVDGFDEMLSDRQVELIDILLSLDANVVIFSRPMPLLKARVEKHKKKPTFVSVVANPLDLDAFIAHMIDMTPGFGELLDEQGIREIVIQKIKEKGGGMFLHVSLHLEALRHCLSHEDILQEIDSLPTQLEDLYEAAIARIKNEGPRRLAVAWQVLTWLLNATGTLSIEDLGCAVATPPSTFSFEPSRKVSEDIILAVCHGLVVVDLHTRRARLSHYTVYQILPALLSDVIINPHYTLARTCITRLIDCGFQDTDTGDGIEGVTQLQKAFAETPLLRYAYKNLGAHYTLAHASPNNAEMEYAFESFVRNCTFFPYDPYASDDGDVPWSLRSGKIRIVHAIQRLTPLHVAIFFNATSLVSKLLSDGIHVDIKTTRANGQDGGWTGLMLAAWVASEEIVEVLLAHGADINQTDLRNGRTALMNASRHAGGLPMLPLLLHPPGLNINQVDEKGWSALMHATVGGQVKAVELLLAVPGIDLNLQTTAPIDYPDKRDVGDQSTSWARMVAQALGQQKAREMLFSVPDTQSTIGQICMQGWSALMIAAHFGFEAVVDRLCNSQHRIDATLVDDQRRSALHLASRSGWASIVRKLLSMSGVDVNGVDSGGNTPLVLAAENSQALACEALLGVLGIDVNRSNFSGVSPMAAASGGGNLTIVQMLLQAPGIAIRDGGDRGMLALARASRAGHDDIVDILLRVVGVDVNLIDKDSEDRSALMEAAANGRDGVVKRLLAVPGVDVNLVDKHGMSALMLTSMRGFQGIVDQLLRAPGINPKILNSDGRSALSLAAEEAHEAIVDMLLGIDGIDPHQVDDHGSSPLMYAAKSGSSRIFDTLLKIPGAELNRIDNKGMSALMLAAGCHQIKGGIHILKTLLERPDTNTQLTNPDGMSALMLAASKGRLKFVDQLLAYPQVILGINNTDNRGCSSLLHAAACWRDGIPVLEALLKVPGIDVNLQSQDGQTALHVAAYHGHHEAIKTLLHAPGIDINLAQNQGKTALILAAEHYGCSLPTIEALLSFPGIDTNRVDNEGWSAAMRAVACQATMAAGSAELLLSTPGIDTARKTPQGRTILMIGVVNGRVPTFLKQLAALPGIDINAKDDEGWSALMHAAAQGRPEVLEALLEIEGINVNLANDHWLTALMIAASFGQTQNVLSMLEVPGVDKEAKDHEGRTALSIAEQQGRWDVVQALLPASAGGTVIVST